MNNPVDVVPVETHDFRELRVLEELGSERPVTQRELARKVGIAVGLANAILKRMARKGLIEVRNLDAKRLAYSITPQGMKEKTRLAFRYMEKTVDFYRQARYRVKDNLLRARAEGIQRVGLYGINDVAEIVYLTLRELGMDLVTVASPRHAGEAWLGMTVQGVEALGRVPVDAVIVTDLNLTPERHEGHAVLDALPSRVWWLEA